MSPRLLPIAGVLLAAAVFPATAYAGAGTVKGRLLFYQNQGSFCPTSRDCTGATYLQSQFNTQSPVGDTKVYIRRASDSGIIGQGTTDANGYFTITWNSGFFPIGVTSNLIWVGEHKDNRFAIRDMSGNQYVFWSTGTFSLKNGATVDIGSLVWGSAGSPNGLANVYDGAWRTWTRGFSFSNRLKAYFTGLEVRAFEPAVNPTCPTSCARGGDNRILLDANSAYEPQGRVAHEMGHIASYKSSRDQGFKNGGDYCYPNKGKPGCGWNLTSPQWAAAGFEEGLATFFGDATFYWQNAKAPHTCLISAAACGTGSFNIETSTGLPASCAANENRWPLTVDRYLWDQYDSRADYKEETQQHNLYEFFDTLNAFDNGRGNHKKDEPWCSGPSGDYICNYDGRSAVDFRINWATWGTNSYDAWHHNCEPVGN